MKNVLGCSRFFTPIYWVCQNSVATRKTALLRPWGIADFAPTVGRDMAHLKSVRMG